MTDEQSVTPETAATEEAVSQDAQTEDQTEAQDGQTEDAPEDAEKRKSRHQKRKEALQRARQEADEAKAAYEAQQEALRKAQAAAQGGAAPKEGDFSSYEEYLVALGAYHAGKTLDKRHTDDLQRQAEERQRAYTEREQARQAEIAATWTEQVAEIRQTHPDFEKVAYSAPIPDHMAEMIATMERGAEVAYALGLDHGLARQLGTLPPYEQAMELARMELRLSGPKPRTQTQAPDPITPVKAKAGATKDPEKMSMAEYRKWRASQK